ncbi:MAG: menaquinone biosynthesis protein [Planctomycetota bacterium]
MIRIGSVPYLNAKVLIYGLQSVTEDYTLTFDTPGALVAKLRRGDLDIALVSSIEYFRSSDYLILPDLSITAYREMWSIQLFHRVPLAAARRVGLDPASQTTNALLQVILREKMRLAIELTPLQPGEDPLARADLDGFVKIGDPCLTFAPPSDYFALDLANEWYLFTNLPFVFALWLTRKGVDLKGVNQKLFLAKREGLRHVDDIARVEAPRLNYDFAHTKNYISRIVHYDLSRWELGGLNLFRKYAARQGLIPDSANFNFYTR